MKDYLVSILVLLVTCVSMVGHTMVIHYFVAPWLAVCFVFAAGWLVFPALFVGVEGLFDKVGLL